MGNRVDLRFRIFLFPHNLGIRKARAQKAYMEMLAGSENASFSPPPKVPPIRHYHEVLVLQKNRVARWLLKATKNSKTSGI
jgi:hypothetical protein